MATRLYMAPKLMGGEMTPSFIDVIDLLGKIGFREAEQRDLFQPRYVRKRPFNGISVSDVVYHADAIYGRDERGNELRAPYYAESGADAEGLTQLRAKRFQPQQISEFNSLRLSELELELANHFDMKHRE